MDDLVSRRLAVDAIESIRGCIWDVDIPSPTVPEYVEHHEQMQMLMRKCDACMSIIVREPAAQPEIIRCKDCNHYDGGLCRRWKYAHVTAEDSFCSEAEMIEPRLHITESEEDKDGRGRQI